MNKLVIVGVISLLVGFGMGQSSVEETIVTKEVPTIVEKVVEKEVVVASTECKRAIEIDNDVFTYIGENLSMDIQDIDNITAYINSVVDERIQNASTCLAQ